ncbi:MAG: nicotinamide mononucleotide transporter [Ruminococcaceae bacterium]|nr:nicotinamide mononucleotide transporter [Oscillospiraceae bacterium]
MKKHYFTKTETALWCASVLLITAAFLLFDRGNYLTLAASLIGVTSLIFSAKGNPIGQVLIIIFSVLYGIISFGFAYYGEMMTYLGMTAPMSVFALVSWLKNPYGESRAEVKVNRIHRREVVFMFALSAVVTVGFYFILKAFGTANPIPSTLSVTTSFLAVYLTFRRCAFFALAYASNDLVLIVLWALAAMKNTSYISVTVCFIIFLVNDIYGFVNWSKIYKRQNERGQGNAAH